MSLFLTNSYFGLINLLYLSRDLSWNYIKDLKKEEFARLTRLQEL